MMEELSKEYLCQVLGVARSGYYGWLKGQARAGELANVEWVQQIKAIYQAKRGTYGSPRMTAELCRAGRKCNHKRVERLTRISQSLSGLRRRGFQPINGVIAFCAPARTERCAGETVIIRFLSASLSRDFSPS
jgi:hypothetical protein